MWSPMALSSWCRNASPLSLSCCARERWEKMEVSVCPKQRRPKSLSPLPAQPLTLAHRTCKISHHPYLCWWQWSSKMWSNREFISSAVTAQVFTPSHQTPPAKPNTSVCRHRFGSLVHSPTNPVFPEWSHFTISHFPGWTLQPINSKATFKWCKTSFSSYFQLPDISSTR